MLDLFRMIWPPLAFALMLHTLSEIKDVLRDILEELRKRK